MSAQPALEISAPATLAAEDRQAWEIAWRDVLGCIVEHQGRRYLGAGAEFGPRVYTRDIAFAAVLSLNRLLPEVVWESLLFTRDLRRRAGLKVPSGYDLRRRRPEMDWEELDQDEKQFSGEWSTNSYARRTDDVIWLWAAGDHLDRHAGGEKSDERARWVLAEGEFFFECFYDGMFDPAVGLYRGQACFVDVHFRHKQTGGYPQEGWTTADCISIFAASTNALYARGMEVLATVAEACGRPERARHWRERRKHLIEAFRARLILPDGSISYFLHPNGQTREPRNDALGAALAVRFGIVGGEAARRVAGEYPVTPLGVPLFSPFFAHEPTYHNNAAWPFVEDLLLQARQAATGRDETDRRRHLLRRAIRDGSFHEVVDVRTGHVFGSARQLWTASAWLGWCLDTCGETDIEGGHR